MKKIVTIIGARPQIIKAAALSRAIRTHYADQLTELIVHTGQHYDENMSQVFFDELGIPAEAYNLQVGSSSHGRQTALMLTGIEEILQKEKPAAIVLYGDTNSTLAGAIAAGKIHVPVVHIEAGLRSFNKAMPEEINRIVCDHVSTLLFSPTATGFQNLVREGFDPEAKGPYSASHPRIYHCGDVMYDNSLFFSEIAEQKTTVLGKYHVTPGEFILATIHRNNNTDEPGRMEALFGALQQISSSYETDVVLPLHPRTAQLLEHNLSAGLLKEIRNNPHFKIGEPASFLEMIALEKNCSLVMTDSGGVQKEAFYFQKPCIILRPETEWVELVECGAAILADANKQAILDAYTHFRNNRSVHYPSLFGDGHAARFIAGEILTWL